MAGTIRKRPLWRFLPVIAGFEIVFLGLYFPAAHFNLYWRLIQWVWTVTGPPTRLTWWIVVLLCRTAATLLISIPAFAVGYLIYERVAVHRPDDGELHCPQCGYILKGLCEPRCPECGRPI